MTKRKTTKNARWSRGWVYIVKANDLYKIGSAKKAHKRIAQLRTGCPFLEEVHHIPCFAFRDVEKWLHRMYKDKRVTGEWFSLTEEDLDCITALNIYSFVPERIACQRALAAYEAFKAERKTTNGLMEIIKARLAQA